MSWAMEWLLFAVFGVLVFVLLMAETVACAVGILGNRRWLASKDSQSW